MDAIFIGQHNPNSANKEYVKNSIFDVLNNVVSAEDIIEISNIISTEKMQFKLTAPEGLSTEGVKISLYNENLIDGISKIESFQSDTLVDHIYVDVISTFLSINIIKSSDIYIGSITIPDNVSEGADITIQDGSTIRSLGSLKEPLTPGKTYTLILKAPNELNSDSGYDYTIEYMYLLEESETEAIADADGNISVDNVIIPYTLAVIDTDLIGQGYSLYAKYLAKPGSSSSSNSGSSIKIVNIEESTEDGGTNTVTFSDGSELNVLNGTKGSDFTYDDFTEEQLENLKGADGTTPHIGDDGYWYIGTQNTGIKAEGVDGDPGDDGVGIAEVYIQDGNLYVRKTDETSAQNLGVVKGSDGNNGVGIEDISSNESAEDDGINSITVKLTDETIRSFNIRNGSKGSDGVTPHIGDNGNWFIGDTDTGVSASGNGTSTVTNADVFEIEDISKVTEIVLESSSTANEFKAYDTDISLLSSLSSMNSSLDLVFAYYISEDNYTNALDDYANSSGEFNLGNWITISITIPEYYKQNAVILDGGILTNETLEPGATYRFIAYCDSMIDIENGPDTYNYTNIHFVKEDSVVTIETSPTNPINISDLPSPYVLLVASPLNSGYSFKVTSSELSGYATEEWVENYVEQYDSIALMQAEKTSSDILELENVYKIQNNPVLKTTAPEGTIINLYNKSLVDKDCIAGNMGSYDNGNPSTGSVSSATASVIIPCYDETGNRVYDSSMDFGTLNSGLNYGKFNISLPDNNPTSDKIDISLGLYGNSPIISKLVSVSVLPDTDYIFIYNIITEYDTDNCTWNYTMGDAYLVQESTTGEGTDDERIKVELIADADGNLDASNLMSSYTLAIIDPSLFGNGYTIYAKYHKPCEVDATYNPTSVNPQSGVAVAQALSTIPEIYYPQVKLNDTEIQCRIQGKVIHLTGVIRDYTLPAIGTLQTIQLTRYGKWYYELDEYPDGWYPWSKILNAGEIQFISCTAVKRDINKCIPVQIYQPDMDSWYAVYSDVEEETTVDLIIDSTYITP